MGTSFAPSYGNLFMGNFKTTSIVKTAWLDNIIVYKRYIDDLFFIWKGGKSDFHNFMHYLNDNEWVLRFTGKITSKSKYLYIKLSITDGTITTKTFFKVDSNSLLNFKSTH